MKRILLLFCLVIGSAWAQITPPPGPGSGGSCAGLAGDVGGTCGANQVNKLTLATASQAVVVDASKNVSSVAYGSPSSAASLVQRDANQNAFANSFVSKWTNVVSAGATTTLTAASSRGQNLTGSSAQTFKLPDATTLQVGASWYFNNNSTGVLTVIDGSSGAITTVPAGGMIQVIAIAVVTTAGSWDWHALAPAITKWGTSGIQNTGTTNNSAMTFGITAQTNTCNPTTDYQNSQGGAGVNWAAVGMAGCVGVASGETNQGAVGLQGSGTNASTTTNVVGGYFPMFASGDGTGSATNQRVRMWGINPLGNDNGKNHVLITNELDFNISGPDTKVLGLQLTGAGTADMSSDSAGVIIGPIGTTHKWPTAVYVTDGSSTVAYIAGASSSGNNVSSQPIRMLSRTSGGVTNTADLTAGPGGGISFTLSAGAGWTFINSTSTTELTIQGGGGITWPGTALASLGSPANGTIIYCSDCANASNPCTASSTGAIAKRLNGAWDCR